RNDFDDNGTIESLVTSFHDEIETPFASKDELVKQLPFLNKEFLSYKKFASASLEELFGKDKLDDAQQKKVFELETSYFENKGDNTFEKKELPSFVQVSQIRQIISDDLNNDGFPDVILMGNNYHISSQLGRLDALHGIVLYNDGQGNFKNIEHLKVDGQVNAIEPITIKTKKGYIIGRNDASPIFLTKKDSL
ncbi:MAG: VCBS repeat-containing protein, partial [Bacteroidota bacterium]